MRSSIAIGILTLILVSLLPPFAFGQIPAEDEKLPEGVIRSLGTTHFRHNTYASGIWSPDSKVIAASDLYHGYFWDVATGKLLGKIPKAYPCEYSPDGKLLVCGEIKGFCIWDIAKKEKRFSVNDKDLEVSRPCFTADSKSLVLRLAKGPIRFYSAETGKLERELPCAFGYGWTFQFLSDKKTIVANEDFAELVFLNIASGKAVRRLKLKDDFYAIEGLSLSPDGKWLVVHQGGHAARNSDKGQPHLSRVIDVASGEEKYRLEFGDEWTSCPSFSPDGRTLTRYVQHSFDKQGVLKTEPCIETIDFATGKIVKTLQLPSICQSVAVSPDGRMLLSFYTSANGTVFRLWTYPDLKPHLPSTGHVWQAGAMTFTPDGKNLCSSDWESTILWDLATGQQKKVWARDFREHGAFGNNLFWCPDGKRFVSWSIAQRGAGVQREPASGSACVYLTDTGKLARKLEPLIGAAAMSPDGKLLAAGGTDNEIALWDVASGQVLRRCTGDRDSTSSIAFSADGKSVAAANDEEVRVWNVDDAKLRFTMKVFGHSSIKYRKSSIAFTPDGLFLAVAYEYEPTQIWDMLDGKPVSQPARDPRRTVQVLDSRLEKDPRGFLVRIQRQRSFAAAGREDSLEVFDVLTGKHLGALPKPKSYQEIAITSSDGKIRATALANGLIEISKVAPLPLKHRFLAMPPAELERNWDNLRQSGPTSFEAYRNLSDGDKAAAVFIGSKVVPVKAVDVKQLIRQLSELSSENLDDRKRAADDLEANALAIEAELRELLTKKDLPEQLRKHAEATLGRIDVQLASEKWLQAFRAVAVLEAIGNRDARDVLSKMASGAPGARLTERARQALARIDRTKSD